MKFSTIERNPETKQLEAVFSFNDRITIVMPVAAPSLTIEMVQDAADELSPNNKEELVSSFLDAMSDLETYTKYRRKIMKNMDIDINSKYIFQLISSGEILTMNEIYWFDWFCDKHGLIGRDYG